MYSLIRNSLVGVSLCVAATSAAALPITFDFSGSSSQLLSRSHTFSSGGLDLKATAGGWRRSLTQSNSGLGVTGFLDSSWEIDGFGPRESVTMSFSRSVRLLGFTLTGVGHRDDYTLSVDDVTRIAGDIPGTGTSAVDLGSQSGFSGTDFGFGITDWDDGYFINSLSVDSADVPEPGTIALFAIGLVGLGIARRRAKN